MEKLVHTQTYIDPVDCSLMFPLPLTVITSLDDSLFSRSLSHVIAFIALVPPTATITSTISTPSIPNAF